MLLATKTPLIKIYKEMHSEHWILPHNVGEKGKECHLNSYIHPRK